MHGQHKKNYTYCLKPSNNPSSADGPAPSPTYLHMHKHTHTHKHIHTHKYTRIQDYYSVIKEPMDLATISRKLEEGEYKTPWEVGPSSV